MEVLPAQHAVHSSTSLSATRHSPLSGQHSAPASQDSSNDSGYSYMLQDSSSNTSQLTNLTDVSSRVSNASRAHLQTDVQRRARTPEDNTLTSPISATSPIVSNGTKRTASGHIKNALSYSSTTSTTGRTRTESMSSTGSRAGELAASLKMRLGYAMTKVQHGWEHKSISELERLTTPKPMSNEYVVSPIDYRPRTAAGHDTYQGVENTMSPPSKRRSGMFGTSAAEAFVFQPGRQLQPAAKIHSHQHNRSTDLRSLPLTTVSANAMSPPQTPVSHFPRRPPTIRTDTQTAEAERDALQALTQLGSPHTSQYSRQQNVSQGNSSQASPLRSEFAPIRRVSFARGESDSSAIETSSEDGRIRGRR